MKQSIIASILLCMALAAGCDGNDNGMERFGENMEDAADRTGEAVEEAGDEVEDTAE